MAQNAQRILIVEDNEDVAMSLKRLLDHFGFEVAVAGTGELCLKLVEVWAPDVVLLDIGLPGMNGYELAAALRRTAVSAGATLIAISASDPEMHPQQEWEARFAAFCQASRH